MLLRFLKKKVRQRRGLNMCWYKNLLLRWEYSHSQCHSQNPWGPTTTNKKQLLKFLKYIHPHVHLEDVADVLGEDGRAEPLLHLVVPPNALVEAGALQDVHDRGKRFPEEETCQLWDTAKILENRLNRRRKKLQIVSHSEYVWGVHYKWFFTKTKSSTSRKSLRR